jgi:hypothetical protein
MAKNPQLIPEHSHDHPKRADNNNLYITTLYSPTNVNVAKKIKPSFERSLDLLLFLIVTKAIS